MQRIPLSHAQSDVLLGTARAMRVAAGMTLAKVFFEVGKGFLSLFGESNVSPFAVGLRSCLLGVVSLLFAFFLFKGARALDAVVHTDQDDQGNLVEAVRQIRNAFLFNMLLLALGFLVGCIMMVIG